MHPIRSKYQEHSSFVKCGHVELSTNGSTNAFYEWNAFAFCIHSFVVAVFTSVWQGLLPGIQLPSLSLVAAVWTLHRVFSLLYDCWLSCFIATVSDRVTEQLESGKPEPIIEEVELSALAPRKPDWDLKRDVSKKLEKLERRTQRAVAELIRELLTVNSKSLPAVETYVYPHVRTLC